LFAERQKNEKKLLYFRESNSILPIFATGTQAICLRQFFLTKISNYVKQMFFIAEGQEKKLPGSRAKTEPVPVESRPARIVRLCL